MAPHYAVLTDEVCLEARGRDAGSFLHAQLSQAVLQLDSSHSTLAGWHDARGRARALFRVCHPADPAERWLLITPADGASELLKKLRLFVLRSAVTLDVARDVTIAAVLGADGPWLARHGVPADTPRNGVVAREELTWIRVGETYWQVLGQTAALARLGAGLAPVDAAAVALEEIRLGIPAVTSWVSERYVAQMLNLDELGAVSFHKGCYPGQEIVARVHHLGGVKRRLRRYSAPGAPPPPGTAVVTGDHERTTVGEVVRSAPSGAGCELLAIVDNAAADLALALGDGAPLHALALPFFVPRD